MVLAVAVFAQFEIQNATATPGSGKVTVTYDLVHSENLPCTISLEVSANGGASYTIIPMAVSGDVGENIMPGIGKTVIWHPAADNMEMGESYRIRITAEDGQIPLPLSGFALVEGGTFHNGTSDVTLSSFYIGRCEVTQESYEAVMSWNPSWYFGNPSRPVERLSWFKAIEYCNRRSMQEGLTPCYSYSTYGTNPANWPAGWNTTNANHTNVIYNWNVDGYRLPTEMEWMYAARGGNLSMGYTYSGGNTPGDVAWYWDNSDIGDGLGKRTHDIGEKTHNELGLFDMSGNVREWCWDVYGEYPNEDQTNPFGASSGSSRVLRGGSHSDPAPSCLVSNRSYTLPTITDRNLGFRVCKSIPIELNVKTPVFDPPAGSYNAAQSVTISCPTVGVSIRYTTNGSEPDESSALYSAPLNIASNTTLKAKAYKLGWTSSPIAEAVYEINLLPASFVLVEGGTFHNGTSNVTLSSFYVDKYEVTQAGYQTVMGFNPAFFTGDPDRPVEQVTWFDAIDYCNRRSMQEGLLPCYSYSTYGTNPDNWPDGWLTDFANHTNVSCNWTASGYRLPTEMEWMFAALGGNLSQGYTYSGSDTIEDVAWYKVNTYDLGWDHPDYGTHSVGGLASNELGIFDMSGNAYELCWDIWSDSYPVGDQTNPRGADSGTRRVARGGGWAYFANYCTVWYRVHFVPTASNTSQGFRCVRIIP